MPILLKPRRCPGIQQRSREDFVVALLSPVVQHSGHRVSDQAPVQKKARPSFAIQKAIS